MKRTWRKNSRGVIALEYMAVLVAVLLVLVGMAYYLRRGIQGRWRQSAQSFSQGRLHGNGTADCYRDPRTNSWADADCYDAKCLEKCDITKGEYNSGKSYSECTGCISGCGCSADTP